MEKMTKPHKHLLNQFLNENIWSKWHCTYGFVDAFWETKSFKHFKYFAFTVTDKNNFT